MLNLGNGCRVFGTWATRENAFRASSEIPPTRNSRHSSCLAIEFQAFGSKLMGSFAARETNTSSEGRRVLVGEFAPAARVIGVLNKQDLLSWI